MLLIPNSSKKGPGGKGLLATRQGTIFVAIGVALLAAILLIVFLKNYRSSVAAEGEPARVLVANGLIEKGSSGDLLTIERMIRTASVRADQLKAGAITDPALLRGRVALRDVLPGQQLVAAEFGPARDTVRSNLGGKHRAINIPVDAIHGMTGGVKTGDRVDVLAGFNTEQGGVGRPVIKKILGDILVLRAAGAPAGEGAPAGQGVVLRVPADSAAHVAYAADNGKLWLVLRPGVGVREAPEELVTLETVLFGKSIKLDTTGGD
jgi:Flp pilus assembly protein CpaB